MKNNLHKLTMMAAAALLLMLTACKKEENDNTVTDADGNVYETVTIGNQVWLRENLKVTRYNDGTPIAQVTDDTEWSTLTTGAYCDHNNNSTTANTYGKLYNWHAVKSGKLAPKGWHIPTKEEWAELAEHLDNDGGSLKETGTTHWLSPNTDATNKSGFTALPAAYRMHTGQFTSIGYQGRWWTTSPGSDPNYYARYYYVDFSFGGIYNNEDWQVNGLSVRCIKD